MNKENELKKLDKQLDKHQWITFFIDNILNDYEVRDIQTIIRDHKINMILNEV